MDKDKTIQDLNEINKQLAKDLDERGELLKKLESNSNQLANEIRKTCIRDITPIERDRTINQSDSGKPKLTFSKSFSNPNAIDENREHEFARKHTLVHLKSNSVCTWIPKNSCSTLRFSIAVSNGAISGTDEVEWIHKNNASFRASNKELLNADYSFVVLRSPFKRLLSFYCDKLCNHGANENDTSYDTAKLVMQTTAKTTFAEFVEILWKDHTLKKRNGHVQDQCDFLIYKNYHDYLALEKFKETSSTIFEKTGVILEDIRPFNSIHTTYGCKETVELNYDTPGELIGSAMAASQKPIAKNMYNIDLIRKVGTLYLNDILLYLTVINDSEEEMGYWLKFM